ncbi:MAG TPA: type VI secretion system baseplate subunit TssK, partial [Gemmatales bacterium]|nr:type VI secretion system baseplate subunit TssK [Gemmatales bacterium]
MNRPAVHWHEGMFLRPHQFQAAEHHQAQVLFRQARCDQHYYWGLRKLVIDPDALAAHRFVIRELEIRLRDGTIITLPEDASELAIDLHEAFEGGREADIYLALPQFRPRQPNLETPSSGSARYRSFTLELEDENTGTNPQPIAFRRLNIFLKHGREELSGYETLQLARLEKSDRAEAVPQLSTSYFPAVLNTEACTALQQDVLQQAFYRVDKKLNMLSQQIITRGITFESLAPGDIRRLYQLLALNEAYAVLRHIALTPGLHPEVVYKELCRLVGQFAFFGQDRRCPELPAYDHDDLAVCFWKARQQLDMLIDFIEEPAFQERPFVGMGLRMQVSVEPAWLEASAWQLFLGVRSTLTQEECVRILTRPERLGMKIGSADRVETIFTRGQEGLRFTHSPNPPRDLPTAKALTFFEIDRMATLPEWQHVQSSLTLAIRLREGDIVGSIDGQRELTIRT